MEPNVPISKPLPHNDTYREDEKSADSRNTIGIVAAYMSKRSIGIRYVPDFTEATSQKSSASIAPRETKNPLLTVKETGTKGIKTNK